MATARCLGTVKTLTRMASVAGKMSAPPMPIAARQAMSSPAEPATRGQHRGEAEHGQADLQHALATEAVAEAAGGHQQAGEHQHVGVDDPLQLAGGGAELADERGQGDVHDGAVDDDDEHGRAEHGEDEPRRPRPATERWTMRLRPIGDSCGDREAMTLLFGTLLSRSSIPSHLRRS